MKKIFVAMMAMAALAACSNEETLSFDKEAIGFSNAFVNNSVRSIDPSIVTGTLDSFLVYGTTKGNHNGAQAVNVFYGVEVEKVDNNTPTEWIGDTWKYSNGYTQYWINGNTYKFAAVVNGEVVETDGDVSLMPTKLCYVADGTTDLLYAENDYGDYNANSSLKTVQFDFNHLLSKVKFIVKNTMTTNTDNVLYQYSVENIQLDGAFEYGDYTIGATTPWDGDGSKKFSFGNVSNATAVGDSTDAVLIGAKGAAAQATSHYERLLIPGTFDATITATYKLWLNGHQVDELPYEQPVTLTLVPGNAYNLIIQFGNPGDEIKFSVKQVNGWVPAEGTNVEL